MHDPTDSLLEEIHGAARQLLRRDRARHSLVTGDLVHQALARLYRQGEEEGLSRADVLGRVAREMRRELVDRARRRDSDKRGEGRRPEQLDPEHAPDDRADPLGALAVDEALADLEAHDPRQARVVELRVYAGLGDAEIADALGCSVRTVGSSWRHARAWLLARYADERSSREAPGGGA